MTTFMNNVDLSMALPRIRQVADEISTVGPRLLVIDDDPLFCKKVKHEGKKKHIDVTICRTLGELINLSGKLPFDAAIVDFYFGDITAVQLVHLIGEEVPVVLVSNTVKSDLPTESWPSCTKSFVHKSDGTAKILTEAVSHAHFPCGHPQTHFIPKDLEQTEEIKTGAKWLGTISSSSVILLLGVVGTFLIGKFALMLLFPANNPLKPIEWDQLSIQKTNVISQQVGDQCTSGMPPAAPA